MAAFRVFRRAFSDKTTHFGFQTVPEHLKKSLVGDVFHRVASRYDLMNDLMSGGVHRLWKDELIRTIGPIRSLRQKNAETGEEESRPLRLLDVAGGTGDITFRFLNAAKQSLPFGAPKSQLAASVVVCDINPSMLSVGRDRAVAQGYAPDNEEISFVEGDAEKLPFPDNSFDLYTIAFGIRNVTRVPVALKEAHRVLRKGGRFLCLEFSQVTNPVLRQAYDAYSFSVIPALGDLVAGDKQSYQYLVESIRNFPPQDEFAAWIETAGFSMVRYSNLTFGTVAIHSGFKL
eukprot:GILJ01007268.1.p1 GENE.GILJ01007268.1~~GILJ01007268.1.p1  ORF type:complete len:288 (+),score=32.15 GILJ01007268.1:31-894(+)